MQAIGERIQVGEAGGYADHLATAVGDCLDLGERAVHELAQRQVVLGGTAFGDFVDLRLRAVDDVIDIALTGVAHLHDARASLDETSKDGALLDDARVVAGIGGGRHKRDKRVEVGRAADAADLAGARELGRDGDGVSGLATAVDIDDRVVDGGVRRAIEVCDAKVFDDVGDGILAEHHRAEDRLLRRDILRWCAIAGRTLVVGDGELGDAHATPFIGLTRSGYQGGPTEPGSWPCRDLRRGT